ncbi:MAG: diaminopimelate epimerase [Bacteroidales bacterium]|nr:diaminopimelate epimerase [Bacteroidales bacterium]
MLYKFTGAGNDFVVIDGRKGDVSEFRTVERIGELCREYKTDGLMILLLPSSSGLSRGSNLDFVMEFYNPDGTGGMMCGNGGRCITAFADMLGLKPAAEDGTWHFLAPDGPHEAKIIDRSFVATAPQDDNGCHSERPSCHSERSEESKWIVRLKMIDVDGVTPMMGGYFLNTGTRHFVKFVDDVDAMDMERDAKPLRWDPAFQPVGTNVNFVERRPDGLHIRTYEKGVEGETLACGTGITASAIASVIDSPVKPANDEKVPANDGVHLQCRRGDWLTVEFKKDGQGFKDVYLTGPAELVKTIELC